MRVTEHRLLEITRKSTSDASSKMADASEELTSGLRVRKASDDPLAWAQAAKAQAKLDMSQARGNGIDRALERLTATDSSLDEITEQVQGAFELAVQMGNGTINAADRAGAAERVQEIIDSVIAAANARGVDGDFLFSGSRTDSAAFDATGTYSGDGSTLEIASGSATSGAAGVLGSDFDPIAVLQNLQSALATNSQAGVDTSIGELRDALDRMGAARASVGFRMQRFEQAQDAAGELELRLSEMQTTTVGADPFAAATRLAEARNTLDTSRALAEEISAMMRR